MEFQTNLAMVTILLLGLGMVLVVEGRDRMLHAVGGNMCGWRSDINLAHWADSQQFYVHDWLYFGCGYKSEGVLEVNQTSYQNCIDTDFITNITRSGNHVFPLRTAKKYYFISGGGYCPQGLKLAITVQDAPPDLSPPSAPSLAPSLTTGGSPFVYSTSDGPPNYFNHSITMIMIMIINFYIAYLGLI